MLSKFKIITVFLLISGGVGVAIGTRFYYAQSRFKIENLPCHNISYIKLFDRGLAGENTVTLANKDSINAFMKMLLTSKQVQHADINFHSTSGLCDIVIHCRDDNTLLLTLYRAALVSKPALKGIISSGEYHYINDGLLGFVMSKLSVKD